jgi:hypothetical protein
MDGLVWAVALAFSVMALLGNGDLPLWERLAGTVFSFLVSFFLFGAMMVIVRRIIATK